MTNNDIQNEAVFQKQACPMTASTNWDPQSDTEEERVRWFSDFKDLPLSVREGLLSQDVADAITDLAVKHEIQDPGKVGEISRIVRDVFFEKIDEEKTKVRVIEKLEIEAQKAGEFVSEIKEVIALVKEVGSRKLSDSTEELPIIPALKKYDKLGDQEITESQIQIEISQSKEFVPPTIKNWLEDYIQKKGAQAHDNLERSDYLYKSKNTEDLSTDERNRLSVVLRSYDRDEVVLVAKDDQRIVFDGIGTEGSESEKDSSFSVGTPASVREKPSDPVKASWDVQLAPVGSAKTSQKFGFQEENKTVASKEDKKQNVFVPEQQSTKAKKSRESAISGLNFQTKKPKQGVTHVVDLKNYS